MSKRYFATTLILAFMLAAPFATAQEKSSAANAPRLTLVEPVKDFGTVPKGRMLDWTFEYKNTGTADLQILAAKPTCGCTVADFDRVIKPGQTGKVTAHVDTSAFVGPISKSVILETNDPSVPAAQVTIAAVVKPYVDAHPVGYVRYNILQGDAEKQSVLLFSEDQEPFEIVKVQSPKEWIHVDVRKAEGAEVMSGLGARGQAQYLLDVTVGGDGARIGPIAEKVHVVTNSKYQPDFWLSVTGLIRPAFMVDPSPVTGVNFGDVAPADPSAIRSIILRSNRPAEPESFVVTKVESRVAGVKADLKSTGNKGEYEVTLQLGKDVKPGSFDGSVLIHTTDRSNPVVTIPVRGTVKTAVASAAAGATK